MLNSTTLKAAFERGEGEMVQCILGDEPRYQWIDQDYRVHDLALVLERLAWWAPRAGRSAEACRAIESAFAILISRRDLDRVLKLLSVHHDLEPHMRLPLNLGPTVTALEAWIRDDAPLGINLLLAAENLEPLRNTMEAHHRRSLDELFQKVVFETPENAHLRHPFFLGLMAANSPILTRLAKLNR